MNLLTKINARNFLKGTNSFFRFVSSESTLKEIENLVKSDKIVLFMKGVPDSPRCGFSNAVCQLLGMHGVEYKSHDVLENDAIREGIKEFSNWPTIPQLYINGEFIGGSDILIQMHQDGSFQEELQKVGIESKLLPLEKNDKE